MFHKIFSGPTLAVVLFMVFTSVSRAEIVSCSVNYDYVMVVETTSFGELSGDYQQLIMGRNAKDISSQATVFKYHLTTADRSSVSGKLLILSESVIYYSFKKVSSIQEVRKLPIYGNQDILGNECRKQQMPEELKTYWKILFQPDLQEVQNSYWKERARIEAKKAG